ncbi:hypothetical protein BD769DRAFT_1705156 [Suillus cothurnatus]|nr:hypothetical protein BD769DRAFT_1705156 [Suillus cothurnatus]
MYHAESFAKLGFDTYLIGYKPILSLTSLSNIRLCYLSESPPLVMRIPFVLAAPIKILYQIATILYTLVFVIPRPPEFIIVQSPPNIPTLALVWLVGGIMGRKVIIDWHNLGYSILALKLGETHPLVNIAKRFEIIFGSPAYAHLFVTNAMRDHLEQEWGLVGHRAVLHDRPPSHFHMCLPLEVHELFIRLGHSISPSLADFLPSASPPYTTQFTEILGLLPNSTSRASSSPRSPSLRKDDTWQKWSCCKKTGAEDYPLLLGSADLGVSLHSSSSALDLPMKIVDMFGCGLPVCALDFACIPELVKDGINGLVFQNASQLAEHLETLLASFPSSPALDSLRSNLQRALQVPIDVQHHVHNQEHQEDDDWEWGSWSENWNRVVKPLVLRDSERFG